MRGNRQSSRHPHRPFPGLNACIGFAGSGEGQRPRVRQSPHRPSAFGPSTYPLRQTRQIDGSPTQLGFGIGGGPVDSTGFRNGPPFIGTPLLSRMARMAGLTSAYPLRARRLQQSSPARPRSAQVGACSRVARLARAEAGPEATSGNSGSCLDEPIASTGGKASRGPLNCTCSRAARLSRNSGAECPPRLARRRLSSDRLHSALRSSRYSFLQAAGRNAVRLQNRLAYNFHHTLHMGQIRLAGSSRFSFLARILLDRHPQTLAPVFPDLILRPGHGEHDDRRAVIFGQLSPGK